MSPVTPSFSIITVCYNSATTLAETIVSVNQQAYPPLLVEHVIVDGGSTDHTLQIIDTYPPIHSRTVVSEKDRGIYDAMNKGIALAKNDWLCFLNSDDQFADTHVLSKIAQTISENPSLNLVYGKVAMIQDGVLINYIGKPIEPKDYWYPCHCMCHQAIFFHRSLFQTYGLFEVGIAGGISDYIWLAKFFNTHPTGVQFVNKVISNFTEDGHSLIHVWDAYRSLLRFAHSFFPWSIRMRFYMQWPKKFLKFKVFQLHKDTLFRRAYRKFKNHLRHT